MQRWRCNIEKKKKLKTPNENEIPIILVLNGKTEQTLLQRKVETKKEKKKEKRKKKWKKRKWKKKKN